MTSCPVCSESFTADKARAHLVAFHAGREGEEEWGCAECPFLGTFDQLAVHCFQRRHDSGAMSLRRPVPSDYMSSLLREIQARLGLLSSAEELNSPKLRDEVRSDLEQLANTPKSEDDTRSQSEYVIVVEDEEQPGGFPTLDSRLTDISEDELGSPSVRAIHTEPVLEEFFVSPTSPVSEDSKPLQTDCREQSEPVLTIESKKRRSRPELPAEPPKTISPIIACQDCGSQFTARNFLHRHRKFCKSVEKQWRCSLCPATFTTAPGRQKHLDNVHSGQSYGCLVCRKTFSRKDHLKTHMNSHSQERPYKCSFCFSDFQNPSSLKEHERRRHTGVKPHKCPSCRYTAASASDVRKHRKTQHALVVENLFL